MPTQTPTTRPILHDAMAAGSDFVGGAAALPVRAAEPGPVVPGSDFAGGALPLTAEVERGQPNEERSSPSRSGRLVSAAPAGGVGWLPFA
jgi:hypothetical protein